MQSIPEIFTAAELMQDPAEDSALSKLPSSWGESLNISVSPTQASMDSKPHCNRDLAKVLRVKSSAVLTYASKNKSSHYKLLKIPKKNGYRIVYNPSDLMRLLQYRILKEVLEKNFEIPDYIYAFERNKSIPVMAKVHEASLMIVSLDIKDYFPSIKQNVIAKLFRDIGFGQPAARTISELVTLGPNVPQGGLTSPKISNIIAAATFGPQVEEFCKDRGLNLTIYADDITVSSKSEFDSKEVIDFVTGVLTNHGFRVNKAKTKVMKKGTRQSRLYVCGAVVNEKVNLIKKERLRLRAIVHNASKNGVEAEASKTSLTPNEFVMRIRGKLNWFAQLNPEGSASLVEKFRTVCTAWDESCKEAPFQYQA